MLVKARLFPLQIVPTGLQGSRGCRHSKDILITPKISPLILIPTSPRIFLVKVGQQDKAGN